MYKRQTVLDRYFSLFGDACTRVGSDVDVAAVEDDWRALYPVAWADFSRFLQGWSPGHWKLHGYSQRLVDEALDTLASEET